MSSSVLTQPTQDLVDFLKSANDAYRAGQPVISDHEYDHVYLAELRRREPNHPFLVSVEPEVQAPSTKTVAHSLPLLSTDKVYLTDQDGVAKYVSRVQAAAVEVGVDQAEVRFRITPKLDGIAAVYEGGVLATRGNGLRGTDITRKLDEGIVIKGDVSARSVGEIVCDQDYFSENLADEMEHPRNFVAGLISAESLSALAQQALDDGAIHLVLFDSLPALDVGGAELIADFAGLFEQAAQSSDYLTDGAVVEVIDADIRAHMGATSHHHTWQIALKSVGETAVAKVIGVQWQVGRGGRLTPVVNIEPVRLSNATIRMVTAHHAGNVRNQMIGSGAEIRLVRSGEVIPKILEVTRPSDTVELPATCPSCESVLRFEGDFLYCTGPDCGASKSRKLQHFFGTLGNVDGFGPAACELLADANMSVLDVYGSSAERFQGVGFGPGQAANLVKELARSRQESVEDWRFLAAFGIRHLGRGDSRKLLAEHHIESVGDLSSKAIEAIHGFGTVTAQSISGDLKDRAGEISAVYNLGFNLTHSSERPEVATDSPLVGKGVVFTGKLSQSRDDMQSGARELGANVQSSVSAKTDFLVTGDKVGAAKIAKAEALGVTVISEAEYLKLIA